MGEALKLVIHMNGGTGKSSYARNSSFQRLILLKSQHILEETIVELILSKYSRSLPKCLNIADLGCSSGPNAFYAVMEIIKSVNKTCRLQLNKQPPSVQVFLNDLIANDFNTLFRMLPKFYEELQKSEDIINIGGGGEKSGSCCYVRAVPGSFYDRLFPDHSMHVLHSSYSLHWLSQVPVGLMNEFGEPLNKKNIYIAETSPPSVLKAYRDQFKKDFKMFLRMRSEELMTKGRLILTFMCKNDEEDGYDYWQLLGNTLHDMVCMEVIGEEQLATFNVPSYFPSIEELKQTIESEDSFTLKKLETFKLKWDGNGIANVQTRGKYVATYLRAASESILAEHFGDIFMNDTFELFAKKASEYMEKGKGIVNNVTLVLVKE